MVAQLLRRLCTQVRNKDKLEIWKREFLFDKGREFIKICVNLQNHIGSKKLEINNIHIPPVSIFLSLLTKGYFFCIFASS